jgi:hypothetical protein
VAGGDAHRKTPSGSERIASLSSLALCKKVRAIRGCREAGTNLSAESQYERYDRFGPLALGCAHDKTARLDLAAIP